MEERNDNHGGRPIRVLIVDDSALTRQILSAMLSEDPAIEVVGTAGDPYFARDKIKQLQPDVLTLDVEMPRMDGITFLRNLMRLHPMPVVMVSSLTERGADVTLDALELGVFDFVTKPSLDLRQGISELGEEIREKVKGAATARVRALKSTARSPAKEPQFDSASKNAANPRATPRSSRHLRTTDKILALGASTGGTEAIKDVLCALPPDAPGVVIAQHIPPRFSETFARRMDSLAAITVKEAEHDEVVLPGYAFVAPGGYHLRVRRSGGRYRCLIGEDEPVNRHKPSVDALFQSLAVSAGPNVTAALLTGMGADGARGLLELREAGAHTFAQDQATSVVWGMPGEAMRIGAAERDVALPELARVLLEHALQDAESSRATEGPSQTHIARPGHG